MSDAAAADAQFVTMTVAGQLFGVPVMSVRDVLGPQRMTPVPLAPPEIAGALNLRGRIVTAVNVRARLDLPDPSKKSGGMNLVVEHKGELFSLMVDRVGDIVALRAADHEANPVTLAPCWHDVSEGIYRLQEELLLALNVPRLLRLDDKATA